MKLKMSLVYFVVLVGTLVVSCSDYQKLLNGDDTSEKYKQAEIYFNNGEYRKANRLLEQIIPKYRGKPQAQRIIFFFAESYFQTKSYLLAAYQYENFVKSYPKSDRIQEASFKAAKSYYFQSPKFSLDQEDTFTAIEKLQIFINLYPNSEYAEEANQMIAELQEKLEKKEFEIAKQYYTIRDYRAAIKSNEIFIASFPGTKFREEALYTKFIASFEIAINSIDSKKTERLEELQQQYNVILRYYPETLFLEDLNKKISQVNAELEKNNQAISQQTE
ncbi:MAG TPA: outer membrane protein assembly factor BamD [Flavobacteriaceae bacterium]|jgi:outer membrane protein assembly factor BamD|nr:outer membrane protein assembly factor BamD [Flavobacteriaceae bacterium]